MTSITGMAWLIFNKVTYLAIQLVTQQEGKHFLDDDTLPLINFWRIDKSVYISVPAFFYLINREIIFF